MVIFIYFFTVVATVSVNQVICKLIKISLLFLLLSSVYLLTKLIVKKLMENEYVDIRLINFKIPKNDNVSLP